jgi:2-amino-4-hydroxy-6-hydroxymethyldihydropteridine diphosphokinase
LTVSAFIALGTNQPFENLEGPALLRGAIAALSQEGLEIVSVSGIWRTPAWPEGSEQPDFHNAVVEIETEIQGPAPLFEVLRGIETAFGRVRRERWGARTLDLDILAMGQMEAMDGGIIIPHPGMQHRAFVLAPLADIAPNWVHPALGLTVLQLLARVERPGLMRRVD